MHPHAENVLLPAHTNSPKMQAFGPLHAGGGIKHFANRLHQGQINAVNKQCQKYPAGGTTFIAVRYTLFTYRKA